VQSDEADTSENLPATRALTTRYEAQQIKLQISCIVLPAHSTTIRTTVSHNKINKCNDMWKQVVKNLDERPHRWLVTPRGRECIRPILTLSNKMVPWIHNSQPPKPVKPFWHSSTHAWFSMGWTTPKNRLSPLGI